MSKDEIIEMARQADWPDSLITPVIIEKLNDFAKLVAQQEEKDEPSCKECEIAYCSAKGKNFDICSQYVPPKDKRQQALERKAENARELGLDYYVPFCAEQTCSKCKAALEAKDEPVGTAGELFSNTALERLDLRPSTNIYITQLPVAEPYKRTWVGLTDEEINASASCQSWKPFAKAIEAKLKEKNT